jgi:carbon monoxide dehydrogenase subunit G
LNRNPVLEVFMRLEHAFTVPVGVKQAWDVLLDLPRIAPCMPGAALTEYTDDGFTGTVKVKLGPINLTYRGTGRFTERDEAARRVVIEANGRDTRSSGTAAATITATLHPDGDDRTEVRVATDLTVTGRPAQFGSGMLADIGGRLIGQFADCLAGQLQGPAAVEEPEAEPAPAEQRPHLAAVPTPAEVEAIDLLEVAGIGALARRYAPFAVAFVAGAAVVWLFGRRRH